VLKAILLRHPKADDVTLVIASTKEVDFLAYEGLKQLHATPGGAREEQPRGEAEADQNGQRRILSTAGEVVAVLEHLLYLYKEAARRKELFRQAKCSGTALIEVTLGQR